MSYFFALNCLWLFVWCSIYAYNILYNTYYTYILSLGIKSGCWAGMAALAVCGEVEELVAGFAIPANFSRSLKPLKPSHTAAAVSPHRPRPWGPRQERAEHWYARGTTPGSGTTTIHNGVVVLQCFSVGFMTFYNIIYFNTYKHEINVYDWHTSREVVSSIAFSLLLAHSHTPTYIYLYI